MKKSITTLFFLILFLNITNAQWEQRSAPGYFQDWFNFGKTAYFACSNTLISLDLETKKFTSRSMVNSDIPGSRLNSMLMLPDSTILISTNAGLATLKNDVVSANVNICTSYPDKDSRNLYMDSTGKIWTFSAHNVYSYNNSEWRTYDLTSYITTDFDIMALFIQNNKVWVQFEDNTKTSTTYYGNVRDDYLKLALIEDTSVVKLFMTKKDFPFRQGTMNLFDLNGDVLLKNIDSIYVYQDSAWKSTQMFNINSDIKPNWYYNFFNDRKGNIWYLASDFNGTVSYPVCYNIEAKTKTEHLKDYLNTAVQMLSDGSIISYSSFAYFIKNDTGWVRNDLTETLGITKPIYYNPLILNGTLYLYVYYSTSDVKTYSFLRANQKGESFDFQNNFPFIKITKFAINQKGQGIFKGTNQYEANKFEVDTGFVNIENIKLNSQNSEFKSHKNGYVYISGYRDSTNKMDAPYLTTWSNSGLINIDMGFKDKAQPVVIDFDFANDMIAAIGEYYYSGDDSLNTYLSVYNPATQQLTKYDKSNSCMPDWYYEKNGLMWFARDTQVISVAFDKDYGLWIGTSYSLIKFSEKGCNIYTLPDYNSQYKISFQIMVYDNKNHELLILGKYPKPKFFYFDIKSEKWDSIDIADAGIKGKLGDIKKLLDNRIWASDDLGYLYNYSGKGKFDLFDLKLKNKPNLGVKIYDFSIDANNFLHLGTDLGLLTNKHLLTGIEENNISKDDILITPNPASDYIEINVPRWRGQGVDLQEMCPVRIFDLLGTEYTTPSLRDTPPYQGGEIRIDISQLPPGVYFVRVGNLVRKFVKM